MTDVMIRGNDDVVAALDGMVASGRVPHAIMFHEDDGGEAFSIATGFLESLFGGSSKVAKLIHPDIHYIFPTNAPQLSEAYMKEFRDLALSNPSFTEAQLGEALGIEGKTSLIAVAEARTLLEKLSLSALEGGYRAVVILLPEKMNQETANRLLKMIEEPPVKTQFLLITHSPEKVLATISSRCQRIRIKPSGVSSDNAANGQYEEIFSSLMDALTARDLLSALEAGDAAAALPSRENARAFCRYASERLRQMFLLQQGVSGLAQTDPRIAGWASRCRRTFPRMASGELDRAVLYISRNVNIKIIFTELVDKLYNQI